jgi:hypothetical protein
MALWLDASAQRSDFRLAVNRVLARLSLWRGRRDGRWFGSFERTSNLLQAMYLLHSLPE